MTDQAAASQETTVEAHTESTAAANWYDGFNDDVKGYVQNKGWKGADSAIESYRNLEKLVGVPPEQIIKLPKNDAPPEAWDAVYAKLGRPDQPSGYGFQAPDGADGTFSDFMANAFFEAGVPKAMAEKLAEKYNGFSEGVIAKQTEQHQAKIVEEAKGLQKKWGAAHEQNVGIAKHAAQSLGMDAATVDALESAMGFAKTMELFHSIGSRMGESSFVGGDAKAGFGVMTPEGAKQRIKTLQSDAGFVAKYTAGDAAARDEMAKLHKWAYPE